jgi:hypothetical protein
MSAPKKSGAGRDIPANVGTTELRLEDWPRDDVFDPRADPAKFAWWDMPIAERYERGYVALDLDLRIRIVGNEADTHELVISYQRGPWFEADALDSDTVLGHFENRGLSGQRHRDWRHDAVLVETIEFMQDGERMARRIIPSVIRLNGLDLIDVIAAQSREHSATLPSPVSTLKGDREGMGFCAGRSVQRSESADEIIEGRSNLVSKIANEYTHANWDWLNVIRPEDVPASIRIALRDKLVDCTFVSHKIRVERFQMLFRPLDPLTATIQMMSGHHSHPEADANRSGGERQGALGGEPASQLGEDRQIRVESDAGESSNSERK